VRTADGKRPWVPLRALTEDDARREAAAIAKRAKQGTIPLPGKPGGGETCAQWWDRYLASRER